MKLHPADIDLIQKGSIPNPAVKVRKQEDVLLDIGQGIIAAIRDLADAIRNQPAPVVNVAPPDVNVTVHPELAMKPTVKRTEIIRDERNPNKVVAMVTNEEEDKL